MPTCMCVCVSKCLRVSTHDCVQRACVYASAHGCACRRACGHASAHGRGRKNVIDTRIAAIMSLANTVSACHSQRQPESDAGRCRIPCRPSSLSRQRRQRVGAAAGPWATQAEVKTSLRIYPPPPWAVASSPGSPQQGFSAGQAAAAGRGRGLFPSTGPATPCGPLHTQHIKNGQINSPRTAGPSYKERGW